MIKPREKYNAEQGEGNRQFGVQLGSLQYLIEWTHEVSLRREDSCALNVTNNNHLIQLLNYNVSS